MDEQKQIEEMARILSVDCGACENCDCISDEAEKLDCMDFYFARALYNAGYRKIPEGARIILNAADQQIVLLTMEEYKEMAADVEVSKEKLVRIIDSAKAQGRKETAREILSRLHCYGDRDEALRRDLLNLADDYEVEVEE